MLFISGLIIFLKNFQYSVYIVVYFRPLCKESSIIWVKYIISKGTMTLIQSFITKIFLLPLTSATVLDYHKV